MHTIGTHTAKFEDAMKKIWHNNNNGNNHYNESYEPNIYI